MSSNPAHPEAAAVGSVREFQPIAAYGLLADCNSAALVDRDGSVGWLCLPRYDSPAVFAQILDPAAGHWAIRPTGAYRTERRYLPGTLVIETTFTTEGGSVTLTDAMAFAEGQRHHDLGFGAPHLLLRSVRGVAGEVELQLELAPRPEYGLVTPLFRATDGGGRSSAAPIRSSSAAESPARSRRRHCVPVSRSPPAKRSGSRCSGRRPRGRLPTRFRPTGLARGSRIRSRAGARGRPSMTSMRGRIVSLCGSARGC